MTNTERGIVAISPQLTILPVSNPGNETLRPLIPFRRALHLAIQSPAISTLSQKHLSPLSSLIVLQIAAGESAIRLATASGTFHPRFLSPISIDRKSVKGDWWDCGTIRSIFHDVIPCDRTGWLAGRQAGSVVQTATIFSRDPRLKNSPVDRSRVIDRAGLA